jgi:hypothetical protein
MTGADELVAVSSAVPGRTSSRNVGGLALANMARRNSLYGILN